MGLSAHLTKAVSSEFLRDQSGGLLPVGCQILPYDELLRRFESSIPGKLLVLAPLIPQSNAVRTMGEDSGSAGLSNLLDTIRNSGTHLESLLDYATRRARQLTIDLGDDTVDYESISQEAVLFVLQSQKDIGNEKGLLDALISREIREAKLTSKRQRSRSFALETLADGGAFGSHHIDLSIFAEYERQQKSVELWEAIDRLPDDQAQIIQLLVSGFEFREISESLNLSHVAVLRKYEQALLTLRNELIDGSRFCFFFNRVR